MPTIIFINLTSICGSHLPFADRDSKLNIRTLNIRTLNIRTLNIRTLNIGALTHSKIENANIDVSEALRPVG